MAAADHLTASRLVNSLVPRQVQRKRHKKSALCNILSVYMVLSGFLVVFRIFLSLNSRRSVVFISFISGYQRFFPVDLVFLVGLVNRVLARFSLLHQSLIFNVFLFCKIICSSKFARHNLSLLWSQNFVPICVFQVLTVDRE